MFGALDPIPGHGPGESVVPNELTMQGGGLTTRTVAWIGAAASHSGKGADASPNR